ncbi:MAG: EAL domain-containing protein [Actinomycetota bacterium]
MGVLEPGGLAHRLIGELFPFHLLIALDGEPTVVEAGATVEQWIARPVAGELLAKRFAISRPRLTELETDDLLTRRTSVFILDVVDQAKQLRGQMLVLDADHVLFVGSPVLTTIGDIEQIGLAMADFAPHDATLDMIVLQRFAQMQVDDLAQRATELQEAVADRDRFSHSAFTDSLTGLANRRAFWRRCEQLVAERRPLALLFVDVDHFKAVNDAHGHAAGDAVLCAIANRLDAAVRRSDLVARLGGDEFAIVLVGADEATTRAIVERIDDHVCAPIDVDGERLNASVSIGVVTDAGGKGVDELVQAADVAMYEGRQVGRGTITWFVERMRDEREERRALTDDLKHALAAGEVTTMYQPIVRLSDRSVVTCEALARWNHAQRGPISPAVFVELAEGAGLVEELDLMMLRNALDQLGVWSEAHPTLGMQVNMSGRSIHNSLAATVDEALSGAGVAADRLTIEITESWLIRNESEVAAILADVAELGVGLHLDDFGTGYSSLPHIHALPISGVKIDRSFVGQAMQSERSRRLIAATIGMAHSLDLDVVAEGVETEAVAELLVDLGCEYAQGFLFSRPRPAAELDELITHRHPDRPDHPDHPDHPVRS